MFAPPGANAKTQTVTFIPNPTDDASATAYKYWTYDATGKYDSEGIDAPYKNPNPTNVGLVEAGDIRVRFVHSSTPDASLNFITLFKARWTFYIGGYDFYIEVKDPAAYKIKKIIFYHDESANDKSGYSNKNLSLKESNNNIVYNETENTSSYEITEGTESIGIHIKDKNEGALSAATGTKVSNSSSPNTVSLAIFKKITVIYEGLPKPLVNTSLSNGSNTLEDGSSYEYDNTAKLRFKNRMNTDLDGTTIYYTIVPTGTEVTEFPVGDAATAAGIKSVPISTDFTVSESGDMYYWTYKPSDGRKSEYSKVTLIRNNRVTFFDYKGNIDGTLTIYSDKNPRGEAYVTPTSSSNSYMNVKRIVYVPAAPNNNDAIIVDVTEGTFSINQIWAFVTKGTSFTIRSQNSSKFKNEIFNCNDNFIGSYKDIDNFVPRCDNIIEKDVLLPTRDPSSTDKKAVFKNGFESTRSFTNSGTVVRGFGQITLVWNPSSETKAPAAPRVSLAPGGAGSYEGGVYKMVDRLDLKIESDGPTYRRFTSLEDSDPDCGFAFGQSLYEVGATYTINKTDLANNNYTNAKLLLQSGVFTESTKTTKSNSTQVYIQLIDATSFSALADIIKPENTGKDILVTNGCELWVTGVYRTRIEGGALDTYYAYV
ncbi:hypothetical protein EEL49_05195, partial [Muribaculaceae bacterium Isolate-104 (HZI)]